MDDGRWTIDDDYGSFGSGGVLAGGLRGLAACSKA